MARASSPVRLNFISTDAQLGAVDRRSGVIRGLSVVTRGEALGHEAWIDDEFLGQVVTAGNQLQPGVKSRFTHPGLCNDGLGTALGRVRNFRVEDQQVRADLHFLKSARVTPNGDLAKYVMRLAAEDADLVASSIVFERDVAAEKQVKKNHTRAGKFQSPDADNVQNFPHFRLTKLLAVDLVDDAAANPNGLFGVLGGDNLSARGEKLLLYVLGLNDEIPDVVAWGVHPERLKKFCIAVLEKNQIQLKSIESEADQYLQRLERAESRISILIEMIRGIKTGWRR